MIMPSAIKAFLAQPRDNFEWMKALPKKAVMAELVAMDPQPEFLWHKVKLGLHQMVGFLLGTTYPAFYFQFDYGTGKTRLALELIDYYWRLKEIKVALVLVPTDTIAESWEEQARFWVPHQKIVTLEGSTQKKWDQLLELEEGIAVVTYAGWKWMLSRLKKDKTKAGKKKGKQRLEFNKKAVEAMVAAIDCIVMDEATAISSRDSLIFRAMGRMAEKIKYRYLLAGKPFGRDPTDLWSQYYVIDLGETLGETLGLFREAFFIKKQSYFGGPYAFDYKFDKTKDALLNKFLRHRSLHYEADECIDLPLEVAIRKYADLPKETREFYERLKESQKASGARPDNTFLRMRQLASGYIGFRDEDDERVEVQFPENPKLDLMMDQLRALPPGCPALIFHQFTPTGRMIMERLEQERMEAGWVYGGTKDYRALKAKFDRKDDYHMVLNWQKGAAGLNLQKSHHIIVVESPTDPINRRNMTARTVRQGQQAKRCFLIDLLIRDTVDEKILDSIAEGYDMQKRILKRPGLLTA